MNHHPHDHTTDSPTVAGFEVPRSPDSSYNNIYPLTEQDGREPPEVPPHLRQTVLDYPARGDTSTSLPQPQNCTLNHLYYENQGTSRSVVVLGLTNRFRSKYVTVVLYKPVYRGSSN
ncbi:kinase modulator [Lithospermum erythrorhizon]|uniref:Kinase modulator n=1 Tax=Lithospermum erythrorhizon TaxID=34254 RepID=A0AAV3Q930_LITER